MNLPNKITMSRIILAFIIIFILIFPFDTTGLSLQKIFVNESLVVDLKYIIAGILFIIASITDFIDGHVAKKKNQVTNYGKILDAVADKVLVDSILVILASTGFISAIIPTVIIIRDIIVDSIRMSTCLNGKIIESIPLGKVKTIFMMLGISLTLFYNLPFELINIRVSDALLIIATVFAIVSAYQYYELNKKIINSLKKVEEQA